MTTPRRTADPAPSRVVVRTAAFGTQFNGSDVRLLAAPADGSLSGEARASIEAFFYKAWKASHIRTAPYHAFIPLDHDDTGQRTWGLMRVEHLGRAAAGDVVVAWAALLDMEQLHEIRWSVHRLLDDAFPLAGVLPKVGTLTNGHEVTLTGRNPAIDAYVAAFDRAAFALHPDRLDLVRGRAIALSPPLRAALVPLTPEAALKGVWDRLGDWRADTSFCTWSGLTTYGASQGHEFHLRIGMAGVDPLPADAVLLGATADGGSLKQPPSGWIGLRAPKGVQPVEQVLDANDDDARFLAKNLWEESSGALIMSGTYVHLEHLAQTYIADRPGGSPRDPGHPSYRSAIQYLLEYGLKALKPREQKALLEIYVDRILPLLGPTLADPNPAHTVASLALQNGALLNLSDQALSHLEPALFDMPEGPHDLTVDLLAALSNPSATVNWSGFLSAARSPRRARPLSERTETVLRLMAQAWGRADQIDLREFVAEIVDELGVDVAVNAVGLARPSDKKAVFAAIATRRSGRGGATLKTTRQRLAAASDALVLLEAGKRLANQSIAGGGR